MLDDELKIEVLDDIVAFYELTKTGYKLGRVWDRVKKENLTIQYLQVGSGIEQRTEWGNEGYLGSMCMVVDHKILVPMHLTYKVKSSIYI